MNEQALQTLYDLAKQEGYTKSFEEFKTLMSQNQEAVNAMYGVAQREGYQKSQEDFKVLVGFTPTVTTPLEEEKKNFSESYGVQGDMASNVPQVPIPVGSSVQAAAEQPLPTAVGDTTTAQRRDPYSGTFLDRTLDDFDRGLSMITPELMDEDEEISVPQFNYRFNDYGFYFEETNGRPSWLGGVGFDAMKVKAANGAETVIDLDAWRKSTDEREAQRLITFLQENKTASEAVLASYGVTKKAKQAVDEEEIRQVLTVFNNQTQEFVDEVQEIAKSKEALDRMEAYFAPFLQNRTLDQDEALKQEYLQYQEQRKQLMANLNALEQKRIEFAERGAMIDEVAGRYAAMKAEQGSFGPSALWNSVVAGTEIILKGGVSGAVDLALAISPWFQDGIATDFSITTDDIINAGLDPEATNRDFLQKEMIDIAIDNINKNKDYMITGADQITARVPERVVELINKQEALSPEEQSELRDIFNEQGFESTRGILDAISGDRNKSLFGEVDETITDILSKSIKYEGGYTEAKQRVREGRFINPFAPSASQAIDINQGLTDYMNGMLLDRVGSRNVTEEWREMQKQEFWSGALYGAFESIPAFASPSKYLRVATLLSQTTQHLNEEMDKNPEFDQVTEADKYYLTAPVGIAVATLENIGFRNVINQKGLLNGLVARAINRSTSRTTAKSFSDFIRQDVESAMARGALTLGAAGLAEGETGLFQEIADISAKKIWNMAYEKDMFKTPDTWGEFFVQIFRAGAQEAIGGLIFGTLPAVSMAATKRELASVDDDTFAIFESLLDDPEYKTAFTIRQKQRIIAGEITEAEAKAEEKAIDNVMSVMGSIPMYYTTEQRKQALQLLLEQKELDAIIKKGDPSLTKQEQKRLAEVKKDLESIRAKAIQEGALRSQQERAIPEFDSAAASTTRQQPAVNPNETYTFEYESEESVPNVFKTIKNGVEIVVAEGKATVKALGSAMIEAGVAVELTEEMQEQQDIAEFFSEETPNLFFNRKGEVAPEDDPMARAIENEKERKAFIEADQRRKQKVKDLAIKAANAIKAVLPNTRIVLHESQSEYEKYARSGSVGFFDWDANTIHISLENARPTTVPHEVFHAIVYNKLGEKNLGSAMITMFDSVKRTLPKDSKISKAIDAFAKAYETEGADVVAEEKLSELFGIMSVEYRKLSKTTKSKIIQFVKDIAARFGIQIGQNFGKVDSEVIDLMNRLSQRVRTGSRITERDLSAFNQFMGTEQGSEGAAGTINIPSVITRGRARISDEVVVKDAPRISEDPRSWIRNFVQEIDLRELNGRKFITNMYDYTTAGIAELGNGLSITLMGGKNYVPYLMELTGKKIGDVSNLAAFNSKENAEGFMDTAIQSGATIFAPHSGSLTDSWQFQQHIFAELMKLVTDNQILTNDEIVELFNSKLQNKDMQKGIRIFNQNSEKMGVGVNITNFDSFASNPMEIVELLSVENNLSTNLRKALNTLLVSSDKFKEAIGIDMSLLKPQQMDQFYQRIMDPMNQGVTGGEIMGLVEFDPSTFEMVKTEPNAIDHHPSFGYTILAKINGIYQPTKFYMSYDITDTYTKYNKSGVEVSKKSEFTKETFAVKNVTSSAGASVKEAKVNVPMGRAQVTPERVTEASEQLSDLFRRDKIPLTVQEAVEIVKHVSSWRSWYDGISELIETQFGEYAADYMVFLFSHAVASNSAATVGTSMNNLNKFYEDRSVQALPLIRKNVYEYILGRTVTSEKIDAFIRAGLGDPTAKAIDMHIFSLLKSLPETKSPTSKKDFANAKAFIDNVAEALNWQPREVQAAMWAANMLRLGSKPDTYEEYINKRLDKDFRKAIEGWRKKGIKPVFAINKTGEIIEVEYTEDIDRPFYEAELQDAEDAIKLSGIKSRVTNRANAFSEGKIDRAKLLNVVSEYLEEYIRQGRGTFDTMYEDLSDAAKGVDKAIFEQAWEAASGKVEPQPVSRRGRAEKINEALSKASGTTQVATTTGSYVKAAKILSRLGVKGDVLDYGAGLGLGTDAMSEVLGKPVESLEINPERWKGKRPPTYTKSQDIDKQYDGIVSLNVINVVPREMRDFIIEDIFGKLKVGGTAVISSRGFSGDIANAKNFELGPEEKSYIVKRRKDGKIIDVYQKGFDGNELVEYVQELLGDSVTVKKDNTFGKAGVIITKESETAAPRGRAQKPMANIINEGRANNFRDSVIKDYLVRVLGYSVKDVEEVMSINTTLFSTMPEAFSNISAGAVVGAKLWARVAEYRNKITEANEKNTRLTSKELSAKIKDYADKLKATYKTVAQINQEAKDYKAKLEKNNARRRVPLTKQEINAQVAVFKDKQIAIRDKARNEAIKKTDQYAKRVTATNDSKPPLLTEQEIMDKVIEFLEQQPEYKAEAVKYTVGSKKKGTQQVKTRDYLSVQQAAMLSELQKEVGIRPTENIAEKIRMARVILAERKRGAASLQKVKSAVRIFIRKSLPKDLYTKKDVIALIKKVDEANEGNIENIMNEVVEFVTSKNIAALDKKIQDILNGKYTAMESGRLKGKKISVRIKERIDFIRETMMSNKATAQEIDDANAKLMTSLNEMSLITNPTPEEVERMADIRLIMLLNNSLQMENNDAYKLQSLDDILSQLTGMIEQGRSEFSMEIEEAARKYNENATIAYEEITGEEIDFGDPDSKELLDKKDFIRNTQKERDRVNNRLKTIVKGILKGIEVVFTSAEALDGLMDKISMSSGEMFGGRLQDMVTNRIDESSRMFKQRMMLSERMIKGKLKELYGNSWAKEARKNARVVATGIYIDVAAVQAAEDAYNADPNPSTYSELQVALMENELYLSQNKMYYLYNQYKDPANRKSFEKKYGKDHARIMAEMEAALTPEVKEFADWQVNEYFPSLYAHYNEVYRRIYRTNMPWNQFYAGRIYRDLDQVESSIDLLADESVYQTVVGAASTKARVNNSNPILDMDGTDVLSTYIRDMEYFAAYAESIRDINKMFSNKHVRNAIIAIHGNLQMKFIDDTIKKIANKGGRTTTGDKIVNTMNNIFITARLALSPVVFIKQLTSMFTYANDIGIRNWIKYSAKNLPELRAIYREVRDNSVYLQDRANESIFRTMETYSEGKMRSIIPTPYQNFLVNFLMVGTKLGDVGAIYMGGLPNYSYYKDQALKRGMSEQDAIQYAVRRFERDTKRTQQSSDLQDKDIFQTSNPIARAMNMFLTSPKQYLRKEIQAVRNLYRKIAAWDRNAGKGTIKENMRTFLMYHVITPMIYQYVSMGLPGLLRGWRDDDDEDLLRAAVIGNLNAIFVLGEIAATLGDLFTDKPWAGESTKAVGILSTTNKMVQLWKRYERTQDPEKKQAALDNFFAETLTLTGLPAPTLKRFYENYSKIGEGEIGEDILRVLNYSEYQIYGPPVRESNPRIIDIDALDRRLERQLNRTEYESESMQQSQGYQASPRGRGRRENRGYQAPQSGDRQRGGGGFTR